MIIGARQGILSGLRRMVAYSMAQNLGVFLIPGSEIVRMHRLDVKAAGLNVVASPRHASVLLVVGEIPPALREAAAVIYAQMMRPRVLFALGASNLSPLPVADIVAGISQQEFIEGVRKLRAALSSGAFHSEVSDFSAPMLQVRIEYTCSMHPEIVRDEPGSCPKCGMDLILREAQATVTHSHTDEHQNLNELEPKEGHSHSDRHHNMESVSEYSCPMHPEVVQNEPCSCPKCGMHLELRTADDESMHEHHNHNHDMESVSEYSCPMHPEVIQNEPGSCPKCGMHLELRTADDESAHEHHNMDHDDEAFMSMIDVTKDLPRSTDGLPMDWINASFGPFFPGLPGGLLLTLTLDGDTVAGSNVETIVANGPLLLQAPMDVGNLVKRLASLDPLTPLSYQALACLALENVASVDVDVKIAKARIVALEHERIVSHLGWLALFAQQTGFEWLLNRATLLQQKFLHADQEQIIELKVMVLNLIKRLQHTPLLKSRTRDIGRLVAAANLTLLGPVARASGIHEDLRSTDKIYGNLGFTPANGKDGDAQARLWLRLDELRYSLELIENAGISLNSPLSAADVFTVGSLYEVSGAGKAVLETPRGLARLELRLDKGQVLAVKLDTPSMHHLDLIESLTEQQELGDALVAVGSLDLSPWELQQ